MEDGDAPLEPPPRATQNVASLPAPPDTGATTKGGAAGRCDDEMAKAKAKAGFFWI